MTPLSSKTVAFTFVAALGLMLSSPAFASVLRTADGGVVTTKDGAPVLVKDAVDDLCDSASQDASHIRERVVFFDSNKSGLTKHARRHLAHMVPELNRAKQISVVGYADRMGNAAYNEKLALKRAKNVRDFLVAKGLKVKKVEVRSLGKSAPQAECPANLPRAEMISCLREDRRVEIEVK